MAANRTDSYNPGFSTYCILYNVENGFPRFSTRNGQTANIPIPRGISHPINICSSCHGLIVCHDPIFNIYYIGNPGYPDSYISLPQTPRPHYPQHTHVVLATDLSVRPPIYHLICAVEHLSPTIYTFDTYSSNVGSWISYSMNDARGHIIPNTGVSCGAYAYWLTEVPRSIIRYDLYNPRAGWQGFFDHLVPPFPESRIQLGRIGIEVVLLAVSVEGSAYPTVTLCFLQGNPPQWRFTSADLLIPNPSQSIPRPIRFESYYIEVFFWANGRLILWENTTISSQRMNVQMLNEAGVHAADGIAHISTPYQPDFFPATTLFD